MISVSLLPQSWTNISLSRDMNNGFAFLSCRDSACIVVSFIKRKLFASPTFFFLSAGTLSACVNGKLAEPLLHTVALRFLCTVFTEETKRLGVEVTTANSTNATALSDIVNGPSASQLCEMLLQVRGGGRGGGGGARGGLSSPWYTAGIKLIYLMGFLYTICLW